MKIIQNETTAANLLLSGDLNAAPIHGPDAERLARPACSPPRRPALVGEQWYNHDAGQATSDPAVRMALTQALDLAQLQKVLDLRNGHAGDHARRPLEPHRPARATPSSGLGCRRADTAGRQGRRCGQGRKPLDADLPLQHRAAAAASPRPRARGPAVGGDRHQGDGQGPRTTRRSRGRSSAPVTGTSPGCRSTSTAPTRWSRSSRARGRRRHQLLRPSTTPTTTRASRRRSAMTGTDGCPTWLDAESALFAAADIVPFANNVVQTFGNGAEFETSRPARADQHPDARRSSDDAGELGDRTGPTAGPQRGRTPDRGPLPRVGPVRAYGAPGACWCRSGCWSRRRS